MALLGISCGGVTLEKKHSVFHRSQIHSPSEQDNEKLVHLKILERKYAQENKPMDLAITRAMILEIPDGKSEHILIDSMSELKKLRENHAFVSLEMTIEHLSHREQFKLGTNQSAFHKRP
jgi:hypothetical protein